MYTNFFRQPPAIVPLDAVGRWGTPQVAIARAMTLRPKLGLLEESSLGLAPQVMRDVMQAIKLLNTKYRTAFLIVEQNVGILNISSHAYVMQLGEFTISEDDPRSLLHDERLERAYVG